MKNKKFLKTLATLTVGAVAAVGCLGFVACGDDEGHTHKYGETYTSAGADGHYQVCTVDGCDNHSATEAHVYDNDSDTTCNKCDYVRTISGTNPGGSTTEKVDHTFTYSFDAIAQKADKTVLTQADFTGANEFLTVGEGVTYRMNKETPLCIESKAEGLKVTFKGTGKITISWGSTSSSNTSGLAIVKADGTYVDATTVGTGVTKLPADDEKENKAGLLTVTGGQNLKSAVTSEFTITEAGTYTIYCTYKYNDGTKDTSRGSRIWGITMVDKY